MTRLALVGLLGACAVPAEPAEPADDVCAAIAAELPGVLAAAQSPGAIVAFEQPDEPLCVVAAGYSDPERGIAAAPDQLYHVGSSTKTFIAATIMLLADEHVFDDKDTLGAWLPGVVENADAIGIAHLVTNTSGIPNYLDVVKAHPELYDVTQPTAPEELVAISQTVPASFVPGERFEYSNTNWILLGLVIERATGKPWREVVRQRLFDRFGLASTYADRLEVPPGRVMLRSWAPYQGANTDVTEVAHPSWADSAGSIVSSVHDMARWTSLLYSGQVYTGDAYATLMKPAVTIASDAKLGYSLGTITKQTAFGDWTGHGGDWVGSRSYLGGIATRGMYVQVATNWIDADRFAVADVAWRAALGAPLGSLAPFVPR